MKKPLLQQEDFWAGLMFVAIGLAAVAIAADYKFGSASRMGPGYFPTVLGGILAILGAATMLRAMSRAGEVLERFSLKTIAIILGAVVVFALALEPLGLFAAVVLMVLVAGTASMHFRVRSYMAVGVGLAMFCALVFVTGLGLPMAVLGTWFTGA